MLIVIFDIDDTLADTSHREYLVAEKGKEDWDKFFSDELIYKDPVISGAVEGYQAFSDIADSVYILSARPERSLDATEEWLIENGFDISKAFGSIILRPDGLNVRSHEFKQAAFEELILKKHLDAFFVFIDDNEKNLDMFSKYGIALKAPEVWDVLR